MQATKKLLSTATLGVLVLGAGWCFRDYYEKIHPLLPDPPPAANLNAQQLATGERIMTELAALEAAAKSAPRDLKRNWALADAYQRYGETEKLAGQLETILKVDANNARAHAGLGALRLALKQWVAAETAYREFARRRPNSPIAWQGLAASLYHQGRYLEALPVARKAVHLNPKDPSHTYVLATVALEYATQFPDPEIHREELALARSKLISLLEVWPQRGDLYFRIGRACAGQHDTKNAVKYLRRARELMPDDPDVAVLLAKSLRIAGERQAARQVVEASLKKNPEDAQLYAILGQFLQTSNAPQASQQTYQAFRKAAELAPDNSLLQERLGLICLRLNKLEEAQGAFERALRLNPHSAASCQNLAAIYARRGDSTKATAFARKSTGIVFDDNQLKQLQELSKVDPKRIPVHLILADRYRTLGVAGAARDEYLLVLRLDPKNERAKNGLVMLKKMYIAQQ